MNILERSTFRRGGVRGVGWDGSIWAETVLRDGYDTYALYIGVYIYTHVVLIKYTYCPDVLDLGSLDIVGNLSQHFDSTKGTISVAPKRNDPSFCVIMTEYSQAGLAKRI